MKRKKIVFFSNYLRHYYLKLFGSLLKIVICFLFFQMTTWWFDENIFSVFSSVHTLQSVKRQCDESPLALLSFLASKVFESRQSETWCPRRTPVDDMQHIGVQMIFNSHLKSIVASGFDLFQALPCHYSFTTLCTFQTYLKVLDFFIFLG